MLAARSRFSSLIGCERKKNKHIEYLRLSGSAITASACRSAETLNLHKPATHLIATRLTAGPERRSAQLIDSAKTNSDVTFLAALHEPPLTQPWKYPAIKPPPEGCHRDRHEASCASKSSSKNTSDAV